MQGKVASFAISLPVAGYKRVMTISDPRIWRESRTEIRPPEDAVESAVGGGLPISRKRVRFRYWLGAIMLGSMIWAGIAVAFGLL